MSVIGPRPGLWNQDILTAERDKYNANDVKPGLTGWAQINGRDELEIPVKAKLDGEYVEKLGQRKRRWRSNTNKCIYRWRAKNNVALTTNVYYGTLYLVVKDFENNYFTNMIIYEVDKDDMSIFKTRTYSEIDLLYNYKP